MTGHSIRKFTMLFAFVLTIAGLALAGPPVQQKNVNEDYNVISAPIDKHQLIQAPINNNHGAGRPGSVTKLPLDNLKAKKYVTEDGRRGWKVNIPGGRALATPAVVDGMVFVGGGFGSYEFYAFDADTGRAKWAIKVSDDGPTAAVVADGVVAFNTESCTLFIVDARTGRHIWSIWLGDPLLSQPAIADGKVFMAYPGNRGHQIIALGLKDGKTKWKSAISGDIISAPVIYKDSVYLTTFDGNVYRFKTRDGKEVWKKDFQATSAPWLYKDQIFVSKREKGKNKRPMEAILRMEMDRGSPNQSEGTWNKKAAPYLDSEVQRKSSYFSDQKADDSSVGFSTGPAAAKLPAAEANIGQGTVRGLWEFQGSRPCVYKGILYLTQGDEVVALNPITGKKLWAKDLSGRLEDIGGHLAAPPSPAGNKLYVATATGDIIVLDRKKGRVKGTIKIGSPMRFQPAIVEGRIFVGSTAGELISINLNDASADGWPMWGGGPTHNGM